MSNELATVQAWQEAANARDIDRLLALSSPEIVLVGPRGRGSGHKLLRDWIDRAGLTLTTQAAYQRGETVVLAQRAKWQSEATGNEASEANLATRFQVRNGQVVELERYDNLASALAAAGLSAADEIRQSSPKSGRVYRVDKFIVPAEARAEFIAKVRTTHDLLRRQPGFLQDFILEQESGPGEFNFVTLVEWAGPEYIAAARTAVQELHREMNFNPQELFARLGIKADLGNYRAIEF